MRLVPIKFLLNKISSSPLGSAQQDCQSRQQTYQVPGRRWCTSVPFTLPRSRELGHP